MHRRLIPAAVAALALAAAPAAGAKEISNAEVCGTDGCVPAVDGEASRMALMTASGRSIAAPPRAPYYDVQRRVQPRRPAPRRSSFVAVPRHRAVRYEDGAWYEMTAEQAALISKLAGGEQPFPAAGLIGAAPRPEARARRGERRRQPAVAGGRAARALRWPRPLTAAARTATPASRRRARAAP